MFNSDEVQFNYSVFCCSCFQYQIIHFQIQDLKIFLISSENFIVFLFYLDPCLVNFCLWSEWRGGVSSLLHVSIQLSQHHLWRNSSLPMIWSLHSCWKLTGCRCLGLFLNSQFYSIVLFTYLYTNIDTVFNYYSFVVHF